MVKGKNILKRGRIEKSLAVLCRSSRSASLMSVHPGHLDIEPNCGVQRPWGPRRGLQDCFVEYPLHERSSMTKYARRRESIPDIWEGRKACMLWYTLRGVNAGLCSC